MPLALAQVCPPPTPAGQPPEFPLTDIIAAVMKLCAQYRISPVRGLRSDDTKESVPGWWRPNTLRRCWRMQCYKVHKVPKQDPPFDEQRQFTFDRGHVFEAWLIAYLEIAKEAGCFGITEVVRGAVVSHPGIGLGGKFDVAVRYNGYWYLLEIKSKEDAEKLRKIKAPDDDHVDQLNDYQVMSNIPVGFVVYFGPTLLDDEGKKTGVKIRPFFHRVSEQRWAETINRINGLEWFRQDPHILAPKTTKTFLECPDCSWRWACERNLSPAAALAEAKQYG